MEENMETNVISDVFGTKVFNDEVMQEYLPKKTYHIASLCKKKHLFLLEIS